MLKNYIDTSFLKGITPELNYLLWASQTTTFADERNTAEQEVMADLIDKGYQVRNLRPRLFLDTTLDTEQIADIGNRMRVVAICTTVTGTATITVSGTNTNETSPTYETAGTSNSLAVGSNTFLLTSYFQFYKYAITGTATVSDVFLVEPNYDFLYAYKWLYKILRNKIVTDGDQYHIKSKDMRIEYNARLISFSPFYDADEDGDIVEAEKETSFNIMRVIH